MTSPGKPELWELSGFEAGVFEVETVEELVVVVAGDGGGVAGEGAGEGAFEVDEAAVLLVEEGVVGGVIETVVGMGGDLDSGAPGAGEVAAFGVPDFAEEGIFAAVLYEEGDPALAMGVPLEGATVGDDGVAVGVVELEACGLGGEFSGFDEIGFGFLSDRRLGFLPDVRVGFGVEGEGFVGGGIENGVEVGGDAGGGEGVAEVEVVAAFVGDPEGVGSRVLPGVGEGEIEDFEEGF